MLQHVALINYFKEAGINFVTLKVIQRFTLNLVIKPKLLSISINKGLKGEIINNQQHRISQFFEKPLIKTTDAAEIDVTVKNQ
ncbi:MAG: hypothetical protein CNLJKLNK_00491 [Holosporales bacterium]